MTTSVQHIAVATNGQYHLLMDHGEKLQMCEEVSQIRSNGFCDCKVVDGLIVHFAPDILSEF